MDCQIKPTIRSSGGRNSPSQEAILAVELLELYGQTLHDDWLRFLDEEILDVH